MATTPSAGESASALIDAKIRDLVTTCFDEIGTPQQFDAFSMIAEKLPVRSIARMVGVPTNMETFFHDFAVSVVKATRINLPVVSDAARFLQKNERDRRERYMRENLDAMAVKVGELQARLVWLETVSGRVAGKIAPKHQIRNGFLIMLAIGVINLVANLLFKAHVSWALFPIAIFAFGWALMVPVVTLLVLDLHPDRRGMASSLQMFVGSTANGIVAGVVSPLVMHSTIGLATASVLMMCVGLCSWVFIRSRWPEIGRRVEEL